MFITIIKNTGKKQLAKNAFQSVVLRNHVRNVRAGIAKTVRIVSPIRVVRIARRIKSARLVMPKVTVQQASVHLLKVSAVKNLAVIPSEYPACQSN